MSEHVYLLIEDIVSLSFEETHSTITSLILQNKQILITIHKSENLLTNNHPDLRLSEDFGDKYNSLRRLEF